MITKTIRAKSAVYTLLNRTLGAGFRGFIEPSRDTNKVVAEPRHHIGSSSNPQRHPKVSEARHHMGSWLNTSRHPEAAEQHHHIGSLLNPLRHPEFISGSSNSNGGQILKQVQNDKTLSEGVPEARQDTSIRNSGEGYINLSKVNSLPSCPPAFRTSGKRCAFTLAEVLITLAIVGVVAILTVPNITQNIYEKSYKAKFGVVKHSVNTAIKKMKVKERISDITESTLYTDKSEFFNKYFKIKKDCGTSPSGCFSDKYDLDGTSTNTTSLFGANSAYYTVFPNGAAVGFLTGGDLPSDKGIFIVDVNGDKKPNVLNKDFFSFEITLYNRQTKIASYYYDEPQEDKPEDPNIPDSPVIPDSPSGGTINCAMWSIQSAIDQYPSVSFDYAIQEMHAWCGTEDGYANDTWAYANKYCSEMGKSLPSVEELKYFLYSNVCQYSGTYFTSETVSAKQVRVVDYSCGRPGEKAEAYEAERNGMFDTICF